MRLRALDRQDVVIKYRYEYGLCGACVPIGVNKYSEFKYTLPEHDEASVNVVWTTKVKGGCCG